MRFSLIICGWLLLSAFASLPSSFTPAANGAITHSLSHYIFPDKVGSFVSAPNPVTEYSPAHDDVSVGYNFYNSVKLEGAPAIAATVYVFPLKAAGENANGEAVNEKILTEIAGTHHEPLQQLHISPAQIGNYSGLHSRFYTAPFGEQSQNRPLLGEVYSFITGPWILEFRFTNDLGDTAKTSDFVRQFLTINKDRP